MHCKCQCLNKYIQHFFAQSFGLGQPAMRIQSNLTKEDRLQQQRQYARRLIDEIKPEAYPINVKLVNNPFLKGEDKFQFILYQLNEYNKKIGKREVSDPYEMASYHKLHSMVSDLAQIDTRDDQKEALSRVHDWFKQQHRLVEQRKDQGDIRYVVTNNYRKYIKLPPQEKEKIEQPPSKYDIPTDLVDRLLEPYYLENRTAHKELEVPIRRLNEYKRKVINIAPFVDTKDENPPQRVLYPVPPKYEPPKDDAEEIKEGDNQQEGKEGEAVPNSSEPALNAQGQPIQGAAGEENKEDGAGLPEQDIGGGFGEEPEEPEDEQPEEVDDKLAPKNKLFTAAVTNIAPQKLYKGQYMQYRGREVIPERSLQQRYLKLQEDILVKQREDKLNIEIATERAAKKSKYSKETQKKLEDMMFKPKYLFSQQQAPQQERLSREDQLKFGFTTNVRAKPRHSEFDLTNHTATTLPRISKDDGFTEKSIRRDRLKSLKSKFSKMLNLTDYEERETAVSMCQYSARRRGISEIIKAHSKSKERLNQLDEVTQIKERLTRNKIGVNIRALSHGLCLPESEESTVNAPENIFPNKELPSNPFMVDTKKKKKKKK